MSASAIVQVSGHIIDSLILPKILDLIIDGGGDYRLLDVDIGRSHADPSHARSRCPPPPTRTSSSSSSRSISTAHTASTSPKP